MADQSRSVDPTAWCRALFDGNVLPLLVCDASTGEILEANDAALACLGVVRAALDGLRLPDLYAADAPAGAARRIVRLDGSHVDLVEQGCAMPGAGASARAARLIVLQDVSAHVAADEAWRRAMEELQRAHALARIGTWAWDADSGAHYTDTPAATACLACAMASCR